MKDLNMKKLIATRPVVTAQGSYAAGEPFTPRDEKQYKKYIKKPGFRAIEKGDEAAWKKRLANDPVLKANAAAKSDMAKAAKSKKKPAAKSENKAAGDSGKAADTENKAGGDSGATDQASLIS